MPPETDARKDARIRAARTFVQGFVAMCLIAAVPVFLDVVSGNDRISQIEWSEAADRAGFAILVAAVMAALAWAQRRREG